MFFVACLFLCIYDFVMFIFCVRLDLLLFLDMRVINIYMYVCMRKNL